MWAVQLTALDGPNSLRVAQVPAPEAAGRVLIAVHGAGVAFPEVLMSYGRYQFRPQLPHVPGTELSGIVREAPADCGFIPGDRVAAVLPTGGALAELAAVPAEHVVRLPATVSLDAGAGLLHNDLSVYFALVERGRLQPGETVLVHGAAGGIGASTLRMAKALGAARVIGVVSTERKRRYALGLGADEVVLADADRPERWPERIREFTDGRGVDVVLDPVGGRRFTDSLRVLAPNGRCLVVGFAEGSIPTVKVNRLLLNNIDVVGVRLDAHFASSPDYLKQRWRRLEPLYADGKVGPPEVSTFPLDEIATAVERIESRQVVGKTVMLTRP